MIASLRRIRNVLLTLSIFGLAVSFASALRLSCGTGESGCMANIFASTTFPETLNVQMGETTAAYVLKGTGWMPFLRLISAYMLLIGVALLIALEAAELYYLKKLFYRARGFTTKRH